MIIDLGITTEPALDKFMDQERRILPRLRWVLLRFAFFLRIPLSESMILGTFAQQIGCQAVKRPKPCTSINGYGLREQSVQFFLELIVDDGHVDQAAFDQFQETPGFIGADGQHDHPRRGTARPSASNIFDMFGTQTKASGANGVKQVSLLGIQFFLRYGHAANLGIN